MRRTTAQAAFIMAVHDDDDVELRTRLRQVTENEDSGSFLTSSRVCSVLVDAVRSNKMDCVRILLASGVDVNGTYNRTKWTPLHHAAVDSDVEMIKLLIANGANVHARDTYEQTPIMVAPHSATTASTECLISMGANVNDADYNNFTALHNAASNRDGLGFVELLLKAGARDNIRDHLGRTPEDCARSFGAAPKNAKILQAWRRKRNMRRLRGVVWTFIAVLRHRKSWLSPPHGGGFLLANQHFNHQLANNNLT